MERDVRTFMGAWESKDYKKFENLWDRCFKQQFNEKFKPSAKCYKNNVGITEYILKGKGKKTGKLFEFDGLVVLTDDHKPIMAKTGNRTPLIINFEYIIFNPNSLFVKLKLFQDPLKKILKYKFMFLGGNLYFASIELIK